jgi:prolyl-tRNA editing enzyme YbaK/EbsC (Cys-tRNA(Pro) deacylase)
MEADSTYEKKLKIFIQNHKISCEHLVFSERCHSVAEAAQAAGVTPRDFVKNVCLIDPQGCIVVAIVKGEDRVDTSRVAKILGVKKMKIAAPEEMLDKTGYPCGGTPSFGYPARFLVDERVMEMEVVYTGGGSEYALVRIRPADLIKGNGGKVVRINKSTG